MGAISCRELSLFWKGERMKWILGMMMSAVLSCTTPSVQEPRPEPTLSIVKTEVPTSDCHRFSQPIPGFLPTHSVMVTRFLKTCALEGGGTGFQENSPFVAMGFPCAGGEGKMEVTGYYYSPKMVRFVLDTACSMITTSQEKIRQAAVQTWNLTPTTSLLAINPFAVQYWEMPGFEEADVGTFLELRSIEGQAKRWNPIIKGQPIEVRLYGRENAWVQENVVYEIRGELHVVAQHRFQLRVKHAKAMTKDEEKVVLQRCKAIQPARDCTQVFTGGI